MNLANQIYLRKSCRKYVDDTIDEGPIHEFMTGACPLNENISYDYKILTKEEVNLKTRWSAPIIWLYTPRKKKITLKI